MTVSIINLDAHLSHLRETRGKATHIAIIDEAETQRRHIQLVDWLRPFTTPTGDTTPRSEWIRVESIPGGQTTIAVTDDPLKLLDFLSQRGISVAEWVQIQTSDMLFPENVYPKDNTFDEPAVRTGMLDESTGYVAAQASELYLAQQAIEDAAQDARRSIAALGSRATKLAQSQQS